MPTAKTYETWQQKGAPYEKNKKQYVIVINPKTGTEKEVRWYNDKERNKLDVAAEKRKDAANAKQQAQILGFPARSAFEFGEKGYIVLLFGDDKTIENWRNSQPTYTAWYNTIFGWFMPSKREVALPINIKGRVLKWEEISLTADPTDYRMKPHEEVREYVKKVRGI